MEASTIVIAAEVDVVEALESFAVSYSEERCARHFDIELSADVPILLNIAVIEIAAHVNLGAPGEDFLAFWVEAAGEVLPGFADIDTGDEAEIGAEAFGAVDVIEAILPFAVLSVENECDQGSAFRW